MAGMADKPDGYFDLAIVDPPYGLGEKLTERGGAHKNSPFATLYKDSSRWDILPQEQYWIELFRVSKDQIIFGANYFLEYLPNTRGFICWDKVQSMPTFSACELVWTSYDKPSKIIRKQSTDLSRFHPTQKPIELYDWILKNYATEGQSILDTHVGSGSSRIAAYKGGFNFTGFEIDPEYHALQEARFREFVMNIAPADLEPVTRHGQIKLF
jgi:site-specific DNA-methyltransferase (adenine-specific)